MFYEIKYVYEGKDGTAVVVPAVGWEEQFTESCLNRIDSLTRAGAVIVDTFMHQDNHR